MKRRALLKAIPAVAVLPAVAAVPAMAMPTDPIIDLCERYIIAFDAWGAASAEEGEGNFDGPLTTRIDAEKIRLSEEIKATPISTAAGFAAYCRFVAVDNFMRDESEDFPDMHRWQWEKIKAWSEARALIGGAA
ncbi:hypothetical protein [Paracoccus sp. 22332]|uniref:hypothetical protein n=1 Tax=Paracoccus sp. 22332 TaxID=3453913 RepID=UPI003F82A6DC